MSNTHVNNYNKDFISNYEPQPLHISVCNQERNAPWCEKKAEFSLIEDMTTKEIWPNKNIGSNFFPNIHVNNYNKVFISNYKPQPLHISVCNQERNAAWCGKKAGFSLMEHMTTKEKWPNKNISSGHLSNVTGQQCNHNYGIS